jgi:hypothetical protein
MKLDTPDDRRYAEIALSVQDACNTLAVTNEWSRRLAVINDTHDWDTARQHPATVLFIDKLSSLARCQVGIGGVRVSEAYDACERLRDGLEVEWEVTPL